MPAPEPMLASPTSVWPVAPGWMMSPKWDGFRLLVAVGGDGRARAWSRHGTSLTPRLGDLLEPFTALPAATVLDGELVALAELEGRPVQDFAAVAHAALRGDLHAARRLQFVVFDLLELAGEHLRLRPGADRDRLLADALPSGPRVRAVQSQPASFAAHEAIVGLGFEGTILKRARSTYRAGRQRAWRKYKARHRRSATLLSLHIAHDGQTYARCDVDGTCVTAAASPSTARSIGRAVHIIYSRVDADGTFREARVHTPAPAASLLA